MGHPGFNRQWARMDEPGRRQRRGGRRGGPWGDFGGWDGPGRQGPPPWVAGLFGLGSMHEQRRGPRARRGVRHKLDHSLRQGTILTEEDRRVLELVGFQSAKRRLGPDPGSLCLSGLHSRVQRGPR